MFKDKQKIKEIVEISLGVLLVAIGFYFFFSPANLITGGVSGFSIIYKNLFGASEIAVSIFILIANLTLLVIGGLILGKKFFYKTVYGTLLLPLILLIFSFIFGDKFDLLSQISSEGSKLLIAAIGGSIFTGLGLGLVFKNNATTGGTDVIQTILHKKMKIPYSVAIFIIDGVVILSGLFVLGKGNILNGIEPMFYAIIALSVSGYVVDKVMISGRSGYTVFIVTNEYHSLKEAIYLTINRGVTKVPAVGGYSESEKDMMICTISRNQLYSLKQIISEIDPKAFSIITKTSESVGLGFH